MKYNSICYADIETTAIPASGVMGVDKIHCIAIKSGDSPTLCYTDRFLPLSNYGGTLQNGLQKINDHEYVVFHNYTFDFVVIEHLLGTITASPLDTMILAKIIYTKDELIEIDYGIQDYPRDKLGSFSLDSFGRRMYFPKGSHSDWSKLSVAMCNYCTQDVEVTYALFQILLQSEHYPSQSIIDLEHEVAYIVAQQVHYGFYFDVERGRKLMQSLMYEQLSIELRLQKLFRPMLLRKAPDVTPAKPRRTKQYVIDESYLGLSAVFYNPFQYTVLKNKKIRFKKYTWFTVPHRIVYTHYSGGDYTPIELVKFDPGSRHKIRHWLKNNYDFTFATFTEKGTPKVDGEALEALGDYGKDLRRYLKIVKDLSQLKGLLEAVRDDSTITSRIDTNGTVTGRFTSSSVNLNQIPAAKEFRQLFTAPEGWTFVGTDFSGQENVNLAEALYEFDGGRLDEINTSGDKDLGTDLHSLNAKSCGVSRTNAKPLWFGFLYGSSSTLTGYTLLGNGEYNEYDKRTYVSADERIQKRLTEPDEQGIRYYPVKSGVSAVYVPYTEQLIKQAIYGEQVQSRLIKSTNGLSDLIKKFEIDVKDHGGIHTLGGRFIKVDSSHKCLNYFCQGQGAESMKYYICTIHRDFYAAGLVHGIHYKHQATIYDEIDMIILDEHVQTVTAILKEAYTKISRQLRMKCTYQGEIMIGHNWAECH